MTWIIDDTWMVIIGALAAIACALPGCFLLLRGMSMMGDAISHAVLPGLAVAFLVTGARASFTMFIGAAVVGVLTAVFTQWISTLGKVDRGASMGIVFTTLFAMGLLLIVQAADHVDLDPSCVLYGNIEWTTLDVAWEFTLGETLIEVPRAAVVLGAVTLLNLLITIAFFKELKISSFDPELATTQGINAQLMHYLLMTQVAITTVAAFEVVGSIIVIAMLITPAATAHLLTDRLGLMLLLSAIIGALSAGIGHLLAIVLPPLMGYSATTTSGMMAVTTGLFFIAAWLFAPRYGWITRLLQRKEVASPFSGSLPSD
ncbi:metal ABC transporter permease [Cerasicoccus fimbriatus]|uniref:metal ABC transporter permease n=1 Tax=Cerasicoccus fimbriatus TaxID=3014554 RepID=UPI0022B55CF1|nr:metal ABC transporter permease [Cerasicoccus sp. TK19100]